LVHILQLPSINFFNKNHAYLGHKGTKLQKTTEIKSKLIKYLHNNT